MTSIAVANDVTNRKRMVMIKLNLFNCDISVTIFIYIGFTMFWVISILDYDRGGRHASEEFYEMYPEIKLAAHEYALQNASKKNASFTVKSLAIYITERFKEITGENLKNGELIR